MKVKILFCAIVLSFSAKAAYSTEQYENITLTNAIQTALEKNPNLKISASDIEIAESSYQQALSLQWPSLDFQSNYSHRNNPMTQTVSPLNVSIAGVSGPLNATLAGLLGPAAPRLPQTITVPENNVKLFGTTLVATTLHAQYPIFTGGKISSIIEQAQLGKQVKSEQATKTKMQVIYDVKRYYYAAQLTNELVSLSKSTYEELNEIATMAESFYQSGENNVNKMDYNKIVNAKNIAATTLLDMEKKNQAAYAALKYAMGLDQNAKVTISSPLQMDHKTQQSLETLVSQAKEFNPQLNSLKLAIKAADAKVKEARSGYFPQVGLFFDKTHLDGNYDGGFVNSDNRNSWTIGVGIKMSLFNGGMTTAQVQTAKLQAEQYKEQSQYVEQGLATAIKNQFIELGSAIEQEKLGTEAYKNSSENVDLSHRAFKIGATNIQEVIHANYFNQIIYGNLVKAHHDSLLSLAEIENMVGIIEEKASN